MKDVILGMAVGDALGVPYEFIAKGEMRMSPCTDMRGYGTHQQPVGTWSDDTSMALCLIDSLCNGLNYTDIANKFSRWMYNSLWTPYGEVFDHGFSTKSAIDRWATGQFLPFECGGKSESSNGNGSVMRTLVLVPFIEDKDVFRRYDIVSKVSSITHAHWISIMSCFLVCEYAIAIRQGFDKFVAFDIAVGSLESVKEIELDFGDMTEEGYNKFFQEFIDIIHNGPKDNNFSGSGFARDTAFTSIWCVITTKSFKEATLKAVNYGDDTDTTGCVTGGLAGILYGVPEDWVGNLARKDDIIELVNKYEAVYESV
jgi:ADP-ribosylglycohydrolase